MFDRLAFGVITQERPEFRQPVADFTEKLTQGIRTIPLADVAAFFGVTGGLLDLVRTRGDIVLTETLCTNDGPEIVVPAGADGPAASVEIEVPMILRAEWALADGGFALTFPMGEFAPQACVQIAILRSCFELKEMRATPSSLFLGFDNEMLDRRYTF